MEGELDRIGQNRRLNFAQANIVTLQAIHNSRISVKLSADQNISNVGNKINFNTELYDNIAEWDNVTNYRFQPKVIGCYGLKAHYLVAGMNPNQTVKLQIYKNGVEYLYAYKVSTANYPTCMDLSADLYLITTDYIEIWGYISDGGARAVDAASSYLMIHRFA